MAAAPAPAAPRLVARLTALRTALAVDLPTAGNVLRAADAPGGGVEAACRALLADYDRLPGYARRVMRDEVRAALAAAGPRA